MQQINKVTKSLLKSNKKFAAPCFYVNSHYNFSSGVPTIGKMKKISFTAFETSVLSILDIIMPNPKVTFNEATGLTTRQYVNSRGDIFQVYSQYDQNKFWELYKESKSENGNPANLKVENLQARNPAQASDEELVEALNTMKSFFNRGTVIQTVDLEVENPEETTQYYLNNGLDQGIHKNSVRLGGEAPLNFRFIKTGSQNVEPNEDALVSTIDHTVINVFRNQLENIYKLFPHEFWGGDCRDLRAEGVQFDTRVLTSNLTNVDQLVPVNNLDATEEEILHRIQAKDSYLPPYIAKAAITNQITRGMYDTNRTEPKNSKDAFLQHIAMGVNTKFGDISFHLQNLKDKGMKLIPAPPAVYYDLTAVDLSQRVLIPEFFKLAGVDAFSLPYTFYNGLLAPKDANVDRLLELLVKDNNWAESDAQVVIDAYNKVQPLFALVGNSALEFNETKFAEEFKQIAQQQGLNPTQENIDLYISMINFNAQKVQRAKDAGSLIDFQIINVGGKNQTGYLDQTFSTPITQGNEGTSGIFLEFLVRTCYGEIAQLIKENKFYNDTTELKACGAFGQGNFGNLMKGQQLGIKKVDEQMKKQQQQSGFAFQLPMIDMDTIRTQPLAHIEQTISEVSEFDSSSAETLGQLSQNLEAIIKEGQKRNLWN